MFRTLRARLILATVGIATLPILILGITAGFRSAGELERQSLVLQGELATRVERDVAAFVSTRLSELRLLERSSQLIGADEAAKAATLARLLAHDQVYQSVAILDPGGNVQAFASRTGAAAGTSDRFASAPFAQAGFWENNTHHVGPILYDTDVREPLIDIAVPITQLRTGTVEAVLSVRVRFKPIWDLLADLSLPEQTEAFVLGSDGQVLAHRSPAVVLAQTVVSLPEAPGRYTLLDGQPGLVVWEPLSLVGGSARVVVTRDVQEALAEANAMLITTAAAAVVLLAVAAIIALQQARSIMRPIVALAGAARRIASGDLATPIEPSGPVEIATLGAVLGDMTGQLRQTITQLERAEFAQRQRALVTLESIGDAVITTDTEGRVVYINPVAERLTGWTQAEAEGQALPDVFHIVDGTTRAPAENPVDRCLAINAVVELANNTILIRRDGSELMIADSAAPIREIDGTVQGVVMVFRDVTERKELEAAVRQGQKMEAIGQLTGGIAHDFNNLLQVIQGHAELLLDDHDGASAEAIMRAAQRGGELTSRLLAFGRRQTLMPMPIETGDLIDGLLSMLSRTIGETYEIRTEVEPGTWPAHADPGQLEASILNLTLNARDAMPNGGLIVISSRNAAPDEVKSDSREAPDGGFVAISVRDTGAGMSEETREKAVEPFYTTKGVGEGSGLGLSMVYGFMRQSGGFLGIDSAPGKGSTITMYLPRATAAAQPAPSPKAPPVGTGRGEMILVVEDDPAVRNQAETSLESLGYRVVAAEDVPAARAALQAHPDIALVLTDVVLPGGESGTDLLTELAQNRPELPVCLMSGYPQPALEADALGPIDPPLLNKPFRRSELAQRVSSHLANRAE